MSRTRTLAVAALSACALAPASATAHQGDPNYRSTITSVRPSTPGLQLQVLNYDDSLELVNRSGKTVVMEGYRPGEPYLRFRADGRVEVNRNSEALYLNDDRDGTGTVPPNARRGAAPDWELVDRTGRYAWHDHRIHYMGEGRPPAVKDPEVRTKAYDWAVPFRVGDRPATISGTLTWVGGADDESGASVAAFAGLGALAALGLGAAVVVRRRRRGPAEPASSPAEAW